METAPIRNSAGQSTAELSAIDCLWGSGDSGGGGKRRSPEQGQSLPLQRGPDVHRAVATRQAACADADRAFEGTIATETCGSDFFSDTQGLLTDPLLQDIHGLQHALIRILPTVVFVVLVFQSSILNSFDTETGLDLLCLLLVDGSRFGENRWVGYH